jgi:hypothetical protein
VSVCRKERQGEHSKPHRGARQNASGIFRKIFIDARPRGGNRQNNKTVGKKKKRVVVGNLLPPCELKFGMQSTLPTCSSKVVC